MTEETPEEPGGRQGQRVAISAMPSPGPKVANGLELLKRLREASDDAAKNSGKELGSEIIDTLCDSLANLFTD